MNKIKRSGKLLKAAFALLFREQKLLIFPLVASVLAFAVALFFIAPVVLYPTGHSVFTAEHWSALVERIEHWFNLEAMHDQHGHPVIGLQKSGVQLLAGHPWTMLAFTLFYFISMFLATFSNVAFYHEIMRALNGDVVSIRRGYQFAASRWCAVLLWSLFAGLIGYFIQVVQERMGFLGRIVTGLVGFVWSAACIFIIPTIVQDKETSDPIKLLKNSVGTLNRTWGETILGFVGIGMLSALAMFTVVMGILLAIAYPMVVLTTPNPGLNLHRLLYVPAIMVLIAVVVATTLSYVGGMINSIYRCALYIYATEGVVPGTFDKELLNSAWKVK